MCISFVCSVPSVGPVFGTVNTSVSEEGPVISWEYFGHHYSLSVEYGVQNSKAFPCLSHYRIIVHTFIPNVASF